MRYRLWPVFLTGVLACMLGCDEPQQPGEPAPVGPGSAPPGAANGDSLVPDRQDPAPYRGGEGTDTGPGAGAPDSGAYRDPPKREPAPGTQPVPDLGTGKAPGATDEPDVPDENERPLPFELPGESAEDSPPGTSEKGDPGEAE